ncbi:MAG: peptidoglycan-binding protein, partial [bacterium]|nr:peptidoglycan-binding protein [bacterium]
ITESSLVIYRYSSSAWSPLESCVVNTGSRVVTCQTSAFSDLALFGDSIPSVAVEASTSKKPGTSIKARVQNLLNMGNYEAADNLKRQWPHLFTQVAPTPISVPSSTSVRNVSSTRELQRFLNTNGFVITLQGPGSLNNETDFFGELTRQALARFQQAHGISPAVGFFGPVTKAFINASSPTVSSALPTAKNESPKMVRDLQLGMNGSDVTRLQELLISAGHSIPAGASGYFGQQTKNALIEYQKANSITPATGFFGPITRVQMNDLLQ